MRGPRTLTMARPQGRAIAFQGPTAGREPLATGGSGWPL